MASNKPASSAVLSTGSVASEVSMLFRTKRVSEIRTIEARIRTEAEEKSDALRELLGTRYKDLLQAADEMASIRDSCTTSVCDALRDMAKSASELREHFVRKSGRYPTFAAPVTSDLERRKKVHIIGSKLKHIVDSPEVLYAHLESGDVYEAAVRYSLASRNYEELQNTSGLEGVANRFAEQRWRQVQVFKDQIISTADQKLVTRGVDADTVSNVMASLIILSGKERNVLTVLDGMFASRTAWIDDEDRNTSGSIPSRVQTIASIVKNTISSMAMMFWPVNGLGVEGLLREVDKSACENLRTLRDSGTIKQACLDWVHDVKAWLANNGKDILSGADTFRVLADTLQSVEEVFSEEGWPGDCKSVLGEPPKLVFDIFTPLVSERAADVASASIQRAVDRVVSDVEATWVDLRVGPHASKVLWSNFSSHTSEWDNEAHEIGSRSAISEERDIAMTVALSGHVESVVAVFESALHEALSDVAAITQRIPSVAIAFDKAIQVSLPRILDAMGTKLESVPESFSKDESKAEESWEVILEKSLFISRCAMAFGHAENVKSAYQFCDGVIQSSEGNRSHTGFAKFCESADSLRVEGYRTWSNRLCTRLQEQLQDRLVASEILQVPMGWAGHGAENELHSTVTGTESSTLKYPTTASTAAIDFVLEACRYVNSAGGFALPEQAIEFLCDEMISAAANAYKHALSTYGEPKEEGDNGSRTGGVVGSDIAIMQMLFDVLMLKQLLERSFIEEQYRDAKVTLKSVEEQLSGAIDPIDLASCRKPLQGAVASYLSRTCILFGSITRGKSGSSPHTRQALSSSSQLASSNLVSLAKTVPRFTYLPAPMPSTYTSVGSGTAGLSAKAAIGALRSEAISTSSSNYKKREVDTSVAGYASKVSESVGRFGRGFFESLTRKVG